MSQTIAAQDFITGVVKEKGEANHTDLALVGANVIWLGTTVGTIADEKGAFTIQRVESTSRLVVSFMGFQSDTIETVGKSHFEISLSESLVLNEVEILHNKKGVAISYLDPWKSENISSKELKKAACCSLSESFETNPSVDVSFTDAVTGTKQIQMLGLAGPNIQISRENIPSVRGLSAIYGMEYIPGSWIESMQLNKGAGSVVNGFESITGQINVELKKPSSKEKLYLNVYANEGGMSELNLFTKRLINKKWSTALLVHGRLNTTKMDRNEDGFMDNLNGRHLFAMNRWKWYGNRGWEGQFGIIGTTVHSNGGQLQFDHIRNNSSSQYWGTEVSTKRIEGYMKAGKLFPEHPDRSVAILMNAVYHNQESYFGQNIYNAKQSSVYQNFIYQELFGNGDHSYKTGVSFQMDNYDEEVNEFKLLKDEWVPGAYFEYTYKSGEKLGVVLGARADYHNTFGLFYTPRLHLRYAPKESFVIRVSGGKGHRTPNVIAENIGLLASSRTIYPINYQNSSPEVRLSSPTSLAMESVWNYGFNLTKTFRLDYRDGSISMDVYRTVFDQQIVVDIENAREVRFYNLEGESYSNSFQTQFDYELIKRFNVRVAYRFYDVKMQYKDVVGLRSKPFVASHRSFINLDYSTRKHWKLDLTINWQGQKRVPSLVESSLSHLDPMNNKSPSFYIINTQITKVWKELLEVYVGAENLLNFRQSNPIVAVQDPFSEGFDASMIWGPVFGRKVYVGVRFSVL